MPKKLISELRIFLEELQPLFYTPHIFSKNEIDDYIGKLTKLEKRLNRDAKRMTAENLKEVQDLLNRIKKLVDIDLEKYKDEQKPDDISNISYFGLYKT